MKSIPAYDPEAVAMYNKALAKLYKQLAVELVLAVLLLAAMRTVWCAYVVVALIVLAIKLWFTWDELDLLKKGCITYLRVEEYENVK